MRKNSNSTMTWNDVVGRRANPVVVHSRTHSVSVQRLLLYCQRGPIGERYQPMGDTSQRGDRLSREQRFPCV